MTLIFHWLGLSTYRDLELDRIFQSLFMISPSILGAATAFAITPELPDNGTLELECHYFVVAPWAFPLAAAMSVLSGLSDLLLIPGEEPAPLLFFLAQGALLLVLGFTRAKSVHAIALVFMWSAAIVGTFIGRA